MNLGISVRMIGARVGGIKKVSERLGVDSVLSIKNRDGKKYCCVNTKVKGALELC